MTNGNRIAPIDMVLEVVQTAHAEKFSALHNAVISQELGLHKATSGMFTARRVKAGGDWALSAIASPPNARLSFLYVVAGTLEVLVDDRVVTLRAHDAMSQVPLTPANLVTASASLEFFELQAHDDPRVREFLPQSPRPLVCIDAPELHVKGQGPRDFFDYRDLGLADITDGRLEIQVIRAQKPRQGGTGWHSHTMAQLSYGLSGWASLGVEGQPRALDQKPGDAFCIPAGCAHNAEAFSADYWALQVQIPARYDTRARPAPATFAA